MFFPTVEFHPLLAMQIIMMLIQGFVRGDVGSAFRMQIAGVTVILCLVFRSFENYSQISYGYVC
jgi:hypothetical protein